MPAIILDELIVKVKADITNYQKNMKKAVAITQTTANKFKKFKPIKVKADTTNYQKNMKKVQATVAATNNKFKKIKTPKLKVDTTKYNTGMAKVVTTTSAGMKKVVTNTKQGTGKIQRRWATTAGSIQRNISIIRNSFLLLSFALVGGGIVRQISKLNDLFEKQRQVLLQTNQVLKSTGGIAGITAKEINKMAVGLQKVTNFGDETTQSAANLLLTFTKIGKDIFPKVLETVLDMSTAFKQDLKSSAIQLGKALQDPIIGVTALRRVGLTLTDQQTEQVKAFAKSGEILKAQTLILTELTTQVGGSARAMADPIIQAKNRISDLAEVIGGEFNDSLRIILPILADVTKGLEVISRIITSMLKGFSLIAVIIKSVAESFGILSAKLSVAGNDFNAFIKDIKEFAQLGLKNIIADLTETVKNFDKNLLDASSNMKKNLTDLGTIKTAFNKLREHNKLIFEDIERDAKISTQGWSDFLTEKIQEGKFNFKSLGDFANLIFRDIAEKLIRLNIVNPLVKQISDPLNAAFSAIGTPSGVAPSIDSAVIPSITPFTAPFTAPPIENILAGFKNFVRPSNPSNLLMGGIPGTSNIPTPESQKKSFGVSGSFADGGNPEVGKVSLVGERGAELFVPKVAGTIIPNDKLGGSTVNIVQNMNFSMGVTETVRAEIKNAAPIIANQAESQVFAAIDRGGLHSKSVKRRR